MANKYWVGGGATTNWNATGNTNWSDSSGGANNATAPGVGDDVFFNGLGVSPNGTVTLNVATTIGSIDCTGFTGTWSHSSGITITLDGGGTNDVLKLVAGMTYVPATNNRLFTFSGAGSMAVTSALKAIGAITISGGGTVVLQDTLTMLASTGVITLTSGTLDGNNQNVTLGTLTASGSTSRTWTIGSGAWVITGLSATPLDVSGTNMTLTPYTGSITVSASATATRTVNLGTSKTFHALILANGASTNQPISLQATTGTTITSLTLTTPVAVQLGSAITYSITNLSMNGTAYDNVNTLIAGNNTAPTIALAGAVAIDWAVLGGITFTTNTLTATDSINLGGLSGTYSVSGPSGGGGVVGVIGS